MDYDGSVVLNDSRENVWQFLMDAKRSGECVPGIETVEIVEPDKVFRVTGVADMGAMHLDLDLTVTITSAEVPSHARMMIQGKASGSHVGAVSNVSLTELDAERTRLDWEFIFSAYGKIATLGTRVLDRVIKQYSQEFISNLAKRV